MKKFPRGGVLRPGEEADIAQTERSSGINNETSNAIMKKTTRSIFIVTSLLMLRLQWKINFRFIDSNLT